LRGAIAPEELLRPTQPGRSKHEEPEFIEPDPREGFSVRNFQIQACKMSTVSDVVVYGDNDTPREEVARLAKRVAQAQSAWQRKMEGSNSNSRLFNTFILTGELDLERPIFTY
jgi:dual specificity MAP kinase phosphatase